MKTMMENYRMRTGCAPLYGLMIAYPPLKDKANFIGV